MQKNRIQIAKRGVVTIPKDMREKYGWREGDALTLVDLDGALLLAPALSEVEILAEKVRRKLEHKGESMSSMLMALREERERYGSKR